MKLILTLFKTSCLWLVLFSTVSLSTAQSITGVQALHPDSENPQWVIHISFSPVPQRRIKEIFLLNTEDLEIIRVAPPQAGPLGIYTTHPRQPLRIFKNPDTNSLEFAKTYELRTIVENNDPTKPDLLLSAGVVLLDPTKALNKVVEAKAKSSEDADIYVSGELNGAHKRKTTFSTEIKLQKYKALNGTWQHTPFFKLKASTDPDADPDKMEMGWAFRQVTNPGYFDHKVKLESERDFGNTNLIYDFRFTYLPPAYPKGRTNFKVFLNPFIGSELGKNLKSPLAAAEGDGIARLLAGTDLRFIFYLKKESEEPDLEWTTSYVRRWPLTDELGFEADEDGNLQLTQFGKGPRDYFSSKVSYELTKFFNVFTEYEWGKGPPSFKLVDHRFRLGLAYKYRFGVK